MDTVQIVNRGFRDRYFYNVSFVNKQLFDSDCIRRLIAVHKLVKKNVLFSDVVKGRKISPTKQPASQIDIKKPPIVNGMNRPISIGAKLHTSMVMLSTILWSLRMRC